MHIFGLGLTGLQSLGIWFTVAATLFFLMALFTDVFEDDDLVVPVTFIILLWPFMLMVLVVFGIPAALVVLLIRAATKLRKEAEVD